MAKGKRATALFEVMSKHKAAGGGRGGAGATTPGGGIPTPKWWFKSQNRADAKAPAETLADYADEGVDTADAVDDPTLRPTTRRVMPPVSSSRSAADPTDDADPTSRSAVRLQPVSVSVDPDRQLINLKLSYTSALIGGFGLFIVVGVAILIGKAWSRGPSPAIANVSTQTLRQNPPTPGVLNVVRRGDGTGAGTNDVSEGTARRNTGGGGPSTGSRPNPNTSDPRPPTTFFTDDPHRQAGLNYVIMQSYPDKETAEKAADFLTKNGVPCTVEKNLPAWRLPWADGCVVVGLRGFAKISNNPQLEAYKKSVLDVSAKFTNGRSRFAAFSPQMYLWRKGN